jgi:hypothetical protein
MDRLIEWLPKNIPAGDETSIVHGDFRLDNTVFHPTAPRILAVLDWELSTLGDPFADFAYHCMSWHLSPGQFRGLVGLRPRRLGIPSEREYIAAYCRRTGREPLPPRDWEFYMAYNMFRIAGILQGIMARALQGNASSADAVDAGKRARPMAEEGWAPGRKDTRRALSTTRGDGHGFRLLPQGQRPARSASPSWTSTSIRTRPCTTKRSADNRAAGNPWVPTVDHGAQGRRRSAAGLWNLFLPQSERGAGLTNLDYAPLCEIMGRVTSRRKPSTATRPTPATWKPSNATATTRSARSG